MTIDEPAAFLSEQLDSEAIMGDLFIKDVNDRALAALQQRARNRGAALDEVVREIIETEALLTPIPRKPEPPLLSEQQRAERNRVAARMAEIRSHMLRPLWADSALLIREDRDSR